VLLKSLKQKKIFFTQKSVKILFFLSFNAIIKL